VSAVVGTVEVDTGGIVTVGFVGTVRVGSVVTGWDVGVVGSVGVVDDNVVGGVVVVPPVVVVCPSSVEVVVSGTVVDVVASVVVVVGMVVVVVVGLYPSALATRARPIRATTTSPIMACFFTSSPSSDMSSNTVTGKHGNTVWSHLEADRYCPHQRHGLVHNASAVDSLYGSSLSD
jgi:hypothetical protein